MDARSNKKIKRIENHIKALDKGYEKMIDILNKDMDKKKDEETGLEDITLKDGQVKTFADGILKASQAANEILQQINDKEDEIEKLKNPNKELTDANKSQTPLSGRTK